MNPYEFGTMIFNLTWTMICLAFICIVMHYIFMRLTRPKELYYTNLYKNKQDKLVIDSVYENYWDAHKDRKETKNKKYLQTVEIQYILNIPKQKKTLERYINI